MSSKKIFSFLSSSKEAINAFVAKAIVKLNGSDVESNHVKLAIYQDEYDIRARNKYTGFEHISTHDATVRAKLKLFLGDNELQTTTESIDNPVDPVSFRESLKRQALELMDSQNIVYMSGGVDSEVVALAFLDAKVKFTVVIFSWLDAKGNVLNAYDTKYAFEFCASHNIKPLVKFFDIETFWYSDEIFKYAARYRCSSPQILTYHKMVEIVDSEIESGIIVLPD